MKCNSRSCSSRADRYADRQVVTQTGSYTSQQMQAARQTGLHARRSQTDEGNDFFSWLWLVFGWKDVVVSMATKLWHAQWRQKERRVQKRSGQRVDAEIHTRQRGIPSSAGRSVHLGDTSIFIFYHGSDCQYDKRGCYVSLQQELDYHRGASVTFWWKPENIKVAGWFATIQNISSTALVIKNNEWVRKLNMTHLTTGCRWVSNL